MKTNRTPYARQHRYLILPFERALAAVPQTAISPLGKRRTEVVILFGMCLLISMISAYDTYMLVRFQETIHELNPIGCWLMDLDNGSVALFVGCKFIGTIFVLTAIAFLYLYREAMAMCVATTLSLGQLILFWFVTYS